MVLRLYLVNRQTGKSTGKKRDYANESLFKRYGIETYKRYNDELNCFDEPSKTKARLCYLGENDKWVEVGEEIKKTIWDMKIRIENDGKNTAQSFEATLHEYSEGNYWGHWELKLSGYGANPFSAKENLKHKFQEMLEQFKKLD